MSEHMVDKQCILLAAGRATRLMPATIELPKAMLSVPYNGKVEPIIQVVFEGLKERYGINHFIIPIDKGTSGQIIERHFTPNNGLVEYLLAKGKDAEAGELKAFYSKLNSTKIDFIKVDEPLGTGYMLLLAESKIKNEFMVAASDTIINDLPELSGNSVALAQMQISEEEFGKKNYSTVELGKDGTITSLAVKPQSFQNPIRIVPLFTTDARIFDFIRKSDRVNGEIDVKEALRLQIESGIKYKGAIIPYDSVYDFGNVRAFTESMQRLASKQRTKSKTTA
ncbi:sugar phosphate nucleotidyltransferase [Candidatus Marsarchaeota archaeon]|nr:sugar phosphate nucleotidyltransferase [Candidatus Marsarchaeota archaeon]